MARSKTGQAISPEFPHSDGHKPARCVFQAGYARSILVTRSTRKG